MPSPEDLAFTRDAMRAGSLLGIAVTDHVIIGKRRHVSVRRLGLVGPEPTTPGDQAVPNATTERSAS